MIYVLGSVAAGLSQYADLLIALPRHPGRRRRRPDRAGPGRSWPRSSRPRERGRYSGYLGAAFAVATVGGPLIGGVITDTSWLGWRWCFYVGVPFAVIALIVLQKTLHLPVVKREVKIDWAGATLSPRPSRCC